MTLELRRPDEFLKMVDKDKGTVDRRIFSDQQIYELELERIFARAWNFMAHGSQIPNPGDFFLTFIGEDRVIAVRDKEGGVQALINSCRHRGNAVCRAEEGHATSFMCTYHGWTYDLKGNLVGVPGFKEVYHEDLKREEWGLIKAAQVDNYKGFWFATMDAEAPPLAEYLGDVGRLSLDMIAAKGDDIRIVEGVQKYTIGCNWKFAADNVWDYYHGFISHASAFMAGNAWRRVTEPGPRQPRAALSGGRFSAAHRVILGEYGHALSGPSLVDQENLESRRAMGQDSGWREEERAKEALGAVGLPASGHPHVFPNMWMTQGNQVSMRMPKGPTKTEIWWFTLVDKNLPQEKREAYIHNAAHGFGPAGMAEQDDGENWDQSTRGTLGVVARRYPLNYAMNLSRGQVIEDETGPSYIDTHVNEHAQLWHYRNWAEWMAAASWADLKADHSPVPHGTV